MEPLKNDLEQQLHAALTERLEKSESGHSRASVADMQRFMTA